MENCIDKNELDYSIHYENWQTESSLESDIEYYTHYLERHNISQRPKNSRILEIGCARGTLLLTLKRLGFENLEGVELDDAQANMCKSQGLKVSQTSAYEFLQKSLEQYDIIFMLDVLEHMPKPEQMKTLKAIFETLSDDGLLFLSVPNALAPLSHYFEHIDWTHYCAFSPTSLGFVLKSSGFLHYALRPTHQEPFSLREKKKPWIDLFKAEFDIVDPIMTPSVVAVCFKNGDNFEQYVNEAPDLMVFNKPRVNLIYALKMFIKKFILRRHG